MSFTKLDGLRPDPRYLLINDARVAGVLTTSSSRRTSVLRLVLPAFIRIPFRLLCVFRHPHSSSG